MGNPAAFASASHGAGRPLPRGQARRTYTIKDLIRQTASVGCRMDAGVLDEIPGAYKSIDKVMAQQTDLVAIEAKLRQVICIKG